MSFYSSLLLGFRKGILLGCAGAWLLLPWLRPWTAELLVISLTVYSMVWLIEGDVSLDCPRFVHARSAYLVERAFCVLPPPPTGVT